MIIKELERVDRPGMTDLIAWLEKSDFLTAPASTKYHLCEPGGLAKHSMNVFNELVVLSRDYCPKVSMDSLRIAALLHDVCKVNFYAPESKRVRSADGQWTDKPGYTVNDMEPLGHGEKSVIILARFIRLTSDEELAIRWHMGAWEGGCDVRTLGRAMDKCPLLKALMLADQMSTFKEGK